MLPRVLLHCTWLRFTSHTISKGRSSSIFLLVWVSGVLLILSLIVLRINSVIYVTSTHIGGLRHELLDLLQLSKDVWVEDTRKLVFILDWSLSWRRLPRLILELLILALEIWLRVANWLSIRRRILVMLVIHHTMVQVQVYYYYVIHSHSSSLKIKGQRCDTAFV